MTQPAIQIGAPTVTGDGAVNFDATVAGYSIQLQMPRAFVDDEIKSTGVAQVAKYFVEHADQIKMVAWARAYHHSTQGRKPSDPLGPVPYSVMVRAPYDRIITRG